MGLTSSSVRVTAWSTECFAAIFVNVSRFWTSGLMACQRCCSSKAAIHAPPLAGRGGLSARVNASLQASRITEHLKLIEGNESLRQPGSAAV